MSWYAFAGKILLAMVVSAVVGSMYGRALEAVTLVLLLIFGFWLYQMRRVQRWLNKPEDAPPDAHGLWGELLARIYLQQRKNSARPAKCKSLHRLILQLPEWQAEWTAFRSR